MNKFFLIFIWLLLCSVTLIGQRSPINITGSSVTGAPGDIVCVEFTVESFDSIIGLQFSVVFDLNEVEFISADGFGDLFNPIDNQTDCSLIKGIVPPHCINASDHYVIAATTSEDLVTGVSIPDGGILIELCFRILGTPSTCTSINFSNFGGAAGNNGLGIPEFVYSDGTEKAEVNITQAEICVVEPDQSNLMADQLSACPSTTTGLGEMHFVVYGGSPPYQIAEPTLGFNTTINVSGEVVTVSNVGQGTYNFTITDMNGDVVTLTMDYQSVSPLTLNENISLPGCDAANNGRIEITPQGGTPFPDGFYNFSWSTSNIQFDSVGLSRNLPSGLYSVTVTDANGCLAQADYDLNAPPISMNINPTNISCQGMSDGVIEIISDGGSGDFNAFLIGVPFSDRNVNGNRATWRNLDAGTYFIVLQDASSSTCEIRDSVIIEIENDLIVSPNFTSVDCQADNSHVNISFTNSNGSEIDTVNVQIIDLSGPSLFLDTILLNENILSLDNLPFSNYEVRSTTPEGCVASDVLNIQASGRLTLMDTEVNNTCEGDSTGSIILQVDTDAPSVSYRWSTGENDTLAELTNLSTGIYEVTITGSNGCLISESFAVDETFLVIDAVPNSNIDCNDTAGDIEVLVSGGTQPYTYTWDAANGSNSPILQNVQSGNYGLTVTDANGCTNSSILSLLADDAIQLSVNPNNPTCFGESDGSLTVNAFQSTSTSSNFDFVWSTGFRETTASSSTVNNLGSGSYWVVASNVDCTSDTAFFELTDQVGYSIDTVNTAIMAPGCNGVTNGSFTLAINDTNNIAGNILTFSIPELLITNQQSPIFNNIGEGIYTIIITDINGCSSQEQLTIDSDQGVQASIDQANSDFPNCGGGGLATIALSTSGGARPFMYSWVNNVSTDSIAVDLAPGTYAVTVTDANGCTDEINNILVDPSMSITADIMSTDPLCPGQFGTIQVSNIDGGSGMGYRYQIGDSPAYLADSVAAILPGSHIVRVFDDEGCSFESQPIVVQQPDPFSVNLISQSGDTIDLGQPADISANITGTSPIDSVRWSPVGNYEFLSLDQLDVRVFPAQTVTFQVDVTNTDGCVASDQITVFVSQRLDIYIANIFAPESNPVRNNHVLKINAGSGVRLIKSFQVFDRWGNVVVNRSNISIFPNVAVDVWDGRRNVNASNEMCEAGVYVYLLEYEDLLGNEGFVSGDVTLIR